METVSFDNVNYVKASAAAKQFGYTSDYIGQLCRAKKISAMLVGRTWFVNLDSIKQYRKSKKTKATKSKKSHAGLVDKSLNLKSERKHVPPVLKKRTAKILTNAKSTSRSTRTLKVSYDKDEESLIPKLNTHIVQTTRDKEPDLVTEAAEESTRLQVKPYQKKETAFVSDDLPEIALSGKLKIETYSDPEPEDASEVFADKKPKNIAMSNKGDEIISDQGGKESSNQSAHESTDHPKGALLSELKNEERVTLADISNNNAKKRQHKKHAFTPTTVLSADSPRLEWFKAYSPLILTSLAIIFSIIILSSASVQEVNTGIINKDVSFDFEYFLNILTN